uniref:Ethanolaminephosphotransferase n=1 Tax=Globodera rostochiensis TaxID=31243 RepID=A0A914GRS8_GLORO
MTSHNEYLNIVIMVLKILNVLFNVKYLSQQQLSGFDHYKYSCIDNSPISTYISHPLWNWVVQFYPRWLAPNVLTLCGASIVMAYSPVELNIPSWVWVVCAVGTFLAHLLDGTDGKQARRTGASGPTGELFDHGFDSWSTVPFTITIFSLFGQGPFSVTPLTLLSLLVAVQSVFIASHWEKYNTGVLFLSWGYDASQYGLVIYYLFAFILGHHSFQFFLFDGFNFAHLCIGAFYVSCVLSLVMSLYNIHFAYWVEKSGKQSCLYEALLPLFPSLLLFGSAIFWGIFSPGKVLDRDPRAFFWTMGVVFSNIAVHLIIAQMSNTRAQTMNLLLLFYTLMAALSSFNLLFSSELLLLRVSSILFTLAHLHFGICVIRQLCDHFNIQPFSLAYLQKRDE